MKKLLQLVLLTFGLTSLVVAQTPVKIHDLKSLTDSSGTVHLFYRIYAEYEGTEYFTDHIYHYNTQTGKEELFLEHFYNDDLGFEYQYYINEYSFFENNPTKYIAIGSSGFENGFIQRYDTASFFGFLIFPEKLMVSGSDSSIVYVSLYSKIIKSLDGGITWPQPEEFYED